jgi:BON domain-containing protein
MFMKTDSEIEQWVLRALSFSGTICSREVCVFACDGVVSLRGSAESSEDKVAIEQATSRAIGGVSVVNELRIRPCTAPIEKVLASVPLAESSIPGVLIQPVAIKQPAVKTAIA